MTKFNVGDKVRLIEDYMDYKKDDVVEVIGFWAEGINYVGKHGRGGAYYNRFELVESKPTKKQRITALENEVAELKLIVHELRGKKATYTATVLMGSVPVDINNAPELKVAPTPNKQRAAIIEKAKKFVEKVSSRQSSWAVNENGNETYQQKCTFNEFIINNEKRTVVVLVKGKDSGKIFEKGIAKCNPSDVFNEFIGKAIALGRALGLDVSEFEQAVQPNEVVPGHIITWDEVPNEPHKVIKRNGDWFDFTNLFNNKDYNNFEYCEIEEFTTILNDTNAKYEVSNNE